LCPVTQAGPYFLAKAFPDFRFKPHALAERAWAAAVRAQTEVERALANRGQRALTEAMEAGKPGFDSARIPRG
jgi:hypothetical protein